MADEYFRPDEMVSQSIAEMNLTEEIAGILDLISKESVRVAELFQALCEGKVELVRKGYEYVRSVKEDAQLKKERAMEYLVRVAPSLLNREIYAFALNHIDSLSQQLDELAFKLSIAAPELVKIDRELCVEASSVASKLREMVSGLLQGTKSLNINKNRAMEALTAVVNGESEVDSVYRSVEQKILERLASEARYAVPYLLMREVMGFAESVADVARDAANDLKYLVFYRR